MGRGINIRYIYTPLLIGKGEGPPDTPHCIPPPLWGILVCMGVGDVVHEFSRKFLSLGLNPFSFYPINKHPLFHPTSNTQKFPEKFLYLYLK